MGVPTMSPIASQVLGSTTSTVTFSNIPQFYKHLCILASAKVSAGSINWMMSFNGSGSNNYFYYGAGGTAGANIGAFINGGSALQTEYYGYLDTTLDAVREIWLINYTKTDRYKSGLITVAANQNNGLSKVMFNRSSTDAINEISLSTGGSTFTVGSTFQLYGIVGA
jgi:hypothetical protein